MPSGRQFASHPWLVTSRPWLVTPRRLHTLLLLATLAGALLPLATSLLKVSANDFELWSRIKVADARVARWIEAWPALDIASSAPWLSDVAWHDTSDWRFNELYRRIAGANAIFLVAMLVLHRPIARACARACDWLHATGHVRARRTVFASALVLFVSYQTRTPLGFFFPGIGGWTYEHWGPAIADAPPASAATETRPTPDELAFLRRTLIEENARHLPRPGYLGGVAMTLHYADGEVLPGSYELTELVFPQYVFGPLFVSIANPGLFARAVQRSLAYRKRGTRFLLPTSIGYPNHSAYMPIDYTGYPPPETLERIRLWTYTLHVREDRSVEIESAREMVAIDVR